MRHYKLTNQNCNSSKLGNCEVCGEYVDNVYYQSEMQDYIDIDGKESKTYYGCHSFFGHKECLISKREGLGKNIVVRS